MPSAATFTLSKTDGPLAPEPEGREELGFRIESSPLLQSGRLSSITFWGRDAGPLRLRALLQRPPGSSGPALVGRPHHQHDAAGRHHCAGHTDASAAVMVGVSRRGGIHVRSLRLCSASLQQTLYEISREFPDALDSLARALRAGLTRSPQAWK